MGYAAGLIGLTAPMAAVAAIAGIAARRERRRRQERLDALSGTTALTPAAAPEPAADNFDAWRNSFTQQAQPPADDRT